MKGRILYLFFAVLLFSTCSKPYVKQKETFSHLSLKENVGDNNSNKTIAEYKEKVERETEKVIAFSTDNLTKQGDESTLGNFVCDALNYSAKKEFNLPDTEIVLMNRGGLRVNLPKGEIKVLNIFELMPFENELVLVKISGEKLFDCINYLAEKKHPYLGLQLKIENGKIKEAKIKNDEIDKSKTYTIITSDYLASGGDNFVFLKEPIELKKSNLKIRDAIIEYCIYLSENKKQIIPYTDGRFQISK